MNSLATAAKCASMSDACVAEGFATTLTAGSVRPICFLSGGVLNLSSSDRSVVNLLIFTSIFIQLGVSIKLETSQINGVSDI